MSMSIAPASNSAVMARLVPAIHVFLLQQPKTWMPGTGQGMTMNLKCI